jgi:predicted alpha-1,6-mannanase (GH76 family)
MRIALLALALAAVLVLPGVAAAPVRADTRDAARAASSFNAMERYLYDRQAGDYREQVGVAAGTHAWPFSQALAANIAIAGLRRADVQAPVRARLDTLERRFRSASAYVAWPRGDLYVDDNEWLAEDFLDWSDLTGDRNARTRAAAIFGAVVDAWDDVAAHPCSGGVFWTTSAANHDRNTVTTANGAIVGLRLYAATKQARYLAWSKRMLRWLDTCLLASDGLYADHIDLRGAVNGTQWSYNQGSVIGANVLLYTLTGDRHALARAEQIADAALAHFAGRWQKGEPPEFAAIFFRNLLALAAADGRDDYVAAAESYGDKAWATARDAHTGLFTFTGKARLLEQAALVQLYAALARAAVTSAR